MQSGAKELVTPQAPEGTKVLAKKDAKKKNVWLGGQKLMERTTPGSTQDKEKQLIIFTARMLKVSPFGVNILGDLPYVNKLGLSQKAKEYNAGVQYKYNWIKRADNDTDKAICECKLVDKDGKDLCDWVLGECSPSTTKMSTLKGYQNHMAQTRAKNRAILETFGVKIHEDMLDRIQQLSEEEVKQHEKIMHKLSGAVTTSSEEVQSEDRPQDRKVVDENSMLKSIKKQAVAYGAEAGKELEFIEGKLGRKVDWDAMDTKQLISLKTELIAKGTKNGN